MCLKEDSKHKMNIETVNKNPITLTEGAIQEIKRLVDSTNISADQYLRIGVKGGGCAGFSYILDFDTKQEGDNMYEIEGIKVIMNIAHNLYLNGIEIDYQTGLNNRGFVYNNPNASKTCGCGTSFG